MHCRRNWTPPWAGPCRPGPVDLAGYIAAWQAVGRPADREAQIVLMRRVADALDVYTRNPLLRHSLRLMRTPARLAGLPELQAFLEAGFDTFGEMRGAQQFLDTVVRRERSLAAWLFAATCRRPWTAASRWPCRRVSAGVGAAAARAACSPRSQNSPVISCSAWRTTGSSRCSSGACCEQAG